MGRFKKTIIDKNGIDKRETGYYSTPQFISKYLTEELLKLNPDGEWVLDPATGKEELLEFFWTAEKKIDSFDIVNYNNYKYSNFHHDDFIRFYEGLVSQQFFHHNIETKYDYIISNPPYNCHELDYIKNNKIKLSKLFPKIGIYNMYSMFLSSMIEIAKEGCIIGVIISDSFLTAKVHSKLREQILDKCSIHQIILCPSNLFASQNADVRTCILILQKGTSYQKDILISNRPQNVDELKSILTSRKLKSVSLESILLSNDSDLNQFIIDVDYSVINLFHGTNIGSIFKCVTCISTGNDKKYLSKVSKEGYSIPFYKNPGKRKFISEPDAYLIDDFMEESLKVKDFMVRNKSLISKEGIVCSSMGLPFSACYLPKEGVSGVNATIFPPSEDIYWLISYLNSSLITYLIRGVLIRSNMVTSGYVSKLPLLEFNIKEKKELEKIALDVLNNKIDTENALSKIDEIVFIRSGIPQNIIIQIKSFVNNLQKTV